MDLETYNELQLKIQQLKEVRDRLLIEKSNQQSEFKDKIHHKNIQIRTLKEKLNKFTKSQDILLKAICDKDCNNCAYIEDCRLPDNISSI